MIVDYWAYNDIIIISNYIFFVDYEKVNYHIWFFQPKKKRASNDLKANINGATLPITNVEKNPDVLIEENLDVPIEENFDKSVEENLNILIKENFALLTPSPNSIHENNHN